MPRKPRFFVPDAPVHVVQRGHNRDPVFIDDGDYQAYLGWLQEAAAEHGCAIHAYVLMTNHIHLLVTPEDQYSIGRMLQKVSRHFGPYLHHTYGTSGSIWEGRYKASLVQTEFYFLACMRYIELNPVRANMVKSPAHYRWSSYRANGQGEEDRLLSPHREYLALAPTKTARCEAYRSLFKSHVDDVKTLGDIRNAWQTGTPLGNELFKKKIEKKLKCKVGYSKRGRPRALKET